MGDFADGKWADIDWADGSPQKIALHSVVGGLLSEATGGDFATGVLAAGANEALIEQLSGLIKDDRNLELAVSQLIGIAAAAVTDGDYAKAAELAKNATAYNRQLHESEEKWLKENAKRFAEEEGISEQEALERLSQQALKDVDYLWRGLLSDGFDSTAKAFLASSEETFTNDLGEQQALFTAKGQQLFRPEMFADTADPQFYRDFVQSGISRDLSAGVIKEFKDSGIALKDEAIELGKLLVEQPGVVLSGLWEGIKGLPQGIVDSFHESGKAIGEGMAVAFDEDIGAKLDAIYGMDVYTAQQTLLLVRTISVVAAAGAVGKVGGKVSAKVSEAISKKLDDVLDELISRPGQVGGAKGITTVIEPKIAQQMGKRGWTQSSIQSVIDKPVRTVSTKDTRFDPVSGSRLNDPATGYIANDGSYVVRNDRTGAIVQVSNKNDPNWVAPWD